MADTSHIRKIIADSGTTQYLIANRDLIRDYHDNYSEYQTGSGEFLPSYGKGTLRLPLDNGSLTLLDTWYAPGLGYNLISTNQLGKKGVERWLRTADKPSQILYDGAILGYAKIDGQCVFWLKENLNPQLLPVQLTFRLRKWPNLDLLKYGMPGRYLPWITLVLPLLKRFLVVLNLYHLSQVIRIYFDL